MPQAAGIFEDFGKLMMETLLEQGVQPPTDNKGINETAQLYEKFQQQEQQKLVTDMKQQTAAEFEKVRNLGFATKQDIEGFGGMIKDELRKEKEEINARIEKQNQTITELRELIFRAKQQGVGLNNGTQDAQVGNQLEKNPMAAYLYKAPRT